MDVVKLLSDLISIPSVNPMGRSLTGPELYEHRVTAYLETFFRELQVPFQRQAVEPLRDNIVARLDGDPGPLEGGEVLLFEAHQDTVPCDGMTIDPFDPQVRDGQIHGRGACDIKGGMAAMLAAFARLARDRTSNRPTLIMACTVNEEHGYTGATALCKLWSEGGTSIIPRRPDLAVVAEPTQLDVVVAHKGTVRWRLHTRGRAIHSSQPHLGDNAIYRMAPVLKALQAYATEVAPRHAPHPLCGQVTLSVGTIRGGLSVNTVPDDCTIEIDRRLLPGEDGRQAYSEVTEYVQRSVGDAAVIVNEEPYMCSSGLADTHNGLVAQQLSATVRDVRGNGAIVGVPFGTDASEISASGVPSVVFGPGSVEQAHTADEWLDLGQLVMASETLYRFAQRGN